MDIDGGQHIIWLAYVSTGSFRGSKLHFSEATQNEANDEG
jgi:hypothetical protein